MLLAEGASNTADQIGTHPSDGRPLVLMETREEWRAWLERNHDSKGGWLVSWKKATGRRFVPYPEAVDEALCFDWIDSRPNKLDGQRAVRLFTPRKPKSAWSRINKEKVARLSTQELMAPAGMRIWLSPASRSNAVAIESERQCDSLAIRDQGGTSFKRRSPH